MNKLELINVLRETKDSNINQIANPPNEELEIINCGERFMFMC